ncbi:DUF736 family protein [Bradyrhizobium prioriisuperbiae]|uniref:DUF736 family protein n=1 Tax=Bradyrhizobium prioriisuperbiae TaxID=2854389 RepID=UPI0028ED990E|nr:DUF736 family protein [Bradyrhizobium prioritasuperba]
MTGVEPACRRTSDPGPGSISSPPITCSDRDSRADARPDFRVLTRGVEIGAGWVRRGETSGGDYVSLSLAAVMFALREINAISAMSPPPTTRTCLL